MATLSTVIVPAKVLKNGRHNIRIAVAHNGETRYILTGVIVDSEKELKNGSVVKRPDAAFLNTKLRGLLQEYQKRIDAIAYSSVLTCPELVAELKKYKEKSSLSLRDALNHFLSVATCKPSSKQHYASVHSTLAKYIDYDTKLQALSPIKVSNLFSMLVKQGLKSSTIGTYMNDFKTLINFTVKHGFVKFEIDPFATITIPKAGVRESWLTVEQVKAIRDLEITNKKASFIRDLFMLSYYLGGINIKDLLAICFKKNMTTLKYERIKTNRKQKLNKYVEFEIPEEAKPIIKRVTDETGYITRTPSQDRFAYSQSMSHFLPIIAKELDIQTLIFYSARKSFSQHAFDLGVSTSVIDYILGHSLGSSGGRSSCLYSYIHVTPQMATDAIRKVLDNLK